ncbi:MAG: SirA family protein [Gammaproteobacteria bacterium]|jgi:tRNA 2-thiouridine synthesizing protein A|nr:SirA family protein [Gammaproteobacteria bacterium]
MMANYELNAKGLLCPMPVIKVQQKIQQLTKGDILTVYCTDPGTQHDLPAWCRVHGHTLLTLQQEQNEIKISLRVE